PRDQRLAQGRAVRARAGALLMSFGAAVCACSPSVDDPASRDQPARAQAALSTADDTDQDGSATGADLCARPPAGEKTDGDGCGLVTQDADLDGVGNGGDLCADTGAGTP